MFRCERKRGGRTEEGKETEDDRIESKPLPELLKLIGNESGQVSPEGQEGAMSAMAKICEDNAKMLQREQNGQRPLNYLLPKFIEAGSTCCLLPTIYASLTVTFTCRIARCR